MLTINAKTKDGSLEDIYEVEKVTARCADPKNPTPGKHDYVDVTMADGREFILAGVDIYVMNKDGNTIAKYILPVLPADAPVTSQDLVN